MLLLVGIVVHTAPLALVCRRRFNACTFPGGCCCCVGRVLTRGRRAARARQGERPEGVGVREQGVCDLQRCVAWRSVRLGPRRAHRRHPPHLRVRGAARGAEEEKEASTRWPTLSSVPRIHKLWLLQSLVAASSGSCRLCSALTIPAAEHLHSTHHHHRRRRHHHHHYQHQHQQHTITNTTPSLTAYPGQLPHTLASPVCARVHGAAASGDDT